MTIASPPCRRPRRRCAACAAAPARRRDLRLVDPDLARQVVAARRAHARRPSRSSSPKASAWRFSAEEHARLGVGVQEDLDELVGRVEPLGELLHEPQRDLGVASRSSARASARR